jgi:OOP family OmpA-OmpF porin
MKKNILKLSFLLLAINFQLLAQEVKSKRKPFDRWSLEVNAGQNKAIRPFTSGHYSSNPNKYLYFSGVNHYDIGLRYMFSNAFGLKLDCAVDQFQAQSGSGSLPFNTRLQRIGLQGVINLGKMLLFETSTNRIGILGHGGLQVSRFSVNQGINNGITEDNGGIMLGITPQFRLTNWLALSVDFTAIGNIRQHLNWDGNAFNSTDNLTGMLYNTSVGFTVYLGNKLKHADWYTDNDNLKEISGIDVDARKRLDEIEILMNDTDRDGILDYLDAENNTPGGVTVDAKGRFIDSNKNGMPDEMEPKKIKDINSESEINVQAAYKDAVAYLVEKGYVNIFFDVNKDIPNEGSTNNVYYIIKFLKEYPEAKIILNGYADSTGDEQKNIVLSERRVQNVYSLLIASGINENRIEVKANGVDSATADSPLGYNLARRVSIIVTK